jgi:hypothetical protein
MTVTDPLRARLTQLSGIVETKSRFGRENRMRDDIGAAAMLVEIAATSSRESTPRNHV